MQGGRILLTGAAGFVGRHVASRARLQGFTVLPFTGDLRDLRAVRAGVARAAPDAVVHLAARKPAAGSHPWGLLSDEIAMAGNLFRALDESAPEAAVLIAGSAAQYGLGLSAPLLESAELRPASAYGAIKTVLETACVTGALRARRRVIWARSFNCLGPGQQPGAPAADLARQVARAEAVGGGVIRTGNLDVVRDFLDVRDVADAYLALLESDLDGVVNVGSGNATRLEDLARLFISRAGVSATLERDPALARTSDPPYIVANIERLKAATEWRPSWALEGSVDAMLQDARQGRHEGPAAAGEARRCARS